MAVTLSPAVPGTHSWLAGDHLLVSGDIEARLNIPVEGPEDMGDGHTMVQSYYIGLSNGAMIRAVNDPERPDWVVELPGAAEAEIGEDERSITITGPIDWVMLSPNRNGHAINYGTLPAWDEVALMRGVVDAEVVAAG